MQEPEKPEDSLADVWMRDREPVHPGAVFRTQESLPCPWGILAIQKHSKMAMCRFWRHGLKNQGVWAVDGPHAYRTSWAAAFV